MEIQRKDQETIQSSEKSQTQLSVALSGRKRSKSWNIEEARDILDGWRQSGLSLLAYSREHGIGYNRLLFWRKKLKGGGPGDFVRINVTRSPGGEIEIALINGRVIRCSAGTDPRYLKTVVDYLER